MKRTLSRQRNAGFTVLELLLALALLVLITSALLGGIRIGRSAWETGRADTARDELEAATRVLGDLLSHAYPAVVSDTGKPPPKLVFVGHRDSCFFVKLDEGETQRGGLELTEIGVKANGPRRNLDVWTSVFRSADAWTATRGDMRATDVLNNIVTFDLSYYGAIDAKSAPAWFDSWVDLDHLPQLISMRIIVMRGARRYDMPLTVALRQE
jgi:general secretion pathway protein J